MNTARQQWRDNLRAALKSRKIKLGDASSAVGNNAEWLSRVLLDKSSPSLDDIIRVCEAYDIPISELFEGVSAPDTFDPLKAVEEGFTEESAALAERIITQRDEG